MDEPMVVEVHQRVDRLTLEHVMPADAAGGRYNVDAALHLPETSRPLISRELADEITDYIAKHATNVMELLEAWDKNKDRLISKPEFRNFLNAMGFLLPRSASDALFNTWDDDGDGNLDYRELVRGARKAAFARGKIPKRKPKPGNRAMTRFNEQWGRRNQAHVEAHRSRVKAADDAWEVRQEEICQERRAGLLRGMQARQEEARQKGTQLHEPWRLQQQRLSRWRDDTSRMWDEAVSQDVVFLPPILTARLAASEPASSPRRRLAEQLTPRHLRERPTSRREALRQVQDLPDGDHDSDDGGVPPR